MEDFYYRKLKVYHQAKALVAEVYNLCKNLPSQESYGLTNQIQRAAVSIPSNIAEGMGRFSMKERVHFIEISYGSLMEVMCQLEVAELLHYITSEQLEIEEKSITEIAKMLIGLRRTMEDKTNNNV